MLRHQLYNQVSAFGGTSLLKKEPKAHNFYLFVCFLNAKCPYNIICLIGMKNNLILNTIFTFCYFSKMEI